MNKSKLRSNARTVAAAGLAMAATIAAGCATVTVKKVPTPSQYATWTDAQQAEADRMEGVRFYLPRPFVNVFESFPVSADVYFVNGLVSSDGRYVHIDNVRADSPLINLFASALQEDGSYQVRVDGSKVSLPSAEAANELQSKLMDAMQGAPSAELQEQLKKYVDEARESEKKTSALAQSARKDANRAADAAARDDTKPPATTGQNQVGVRNDNAAFAVQPLRGNFDVVYLPDFEEQYVVESRSRLGNAKFQLNLGQGWSLQGFDSLTDNSEINKRFFDLIDTSIAAAKAAAGAFVPGAGPAATLANMFQSARMSGPEETAAVTIPPTPVTLKIVVLHYAAKGLYPVLKPRELLRQAPSAVVIDPFDSGPMVRSVGDLRDPALRDAVARYAADSGRSTIPVYPYQYISFNTFRYAAVELVTSSGVPFGTLYNTTGVKGEPGATRLTDPAGYAAPKDEGKARTSTLGADEHAKKLQSALTSSTRSELSPVAKKLRVMTSGEGKKRVVVRLPILPTEASAPPSLPRTVRDAIASEVAVYKNTANDMDLEIMLNIPPAAEDLDPASTSPGSLRRLFNEELATKGGNGSKWQFEVTRVVPPDGADYDVAFEYTLTPLNPDETEDATKAEESLRQALLRLWVQGKGEEKAVKLTRKPA